MNVAGRGNAVLSESAVEFGAEVAGTGQIVWIVGEHPRIDQHTPTEKIVALNRSSHSNCITANVGSLDQRECQRCAPAP